MWQSVKIREERYEQVSELARIEGRSVANMVDRLIVRGLREPSVVDEPEGALVEPEKAVPPVAQRQSAGHEPEAAGSTPARRPESSGSASAPRWVPAESDLSAPRKRSTQTAAEIAASLGLKRGSEFEAKPFSKGDQAGRGK